MTGPVEVSAPGTRVVLGEGPRGIAVEPGRLQLRDELAVRAAAAFRTARDLVQ